MRHIAQDAPVVVIGVVSSTSDVAYMEEEPRRDYVIIPTFSDNEIREFLRKQGLAKAAVDLIVKKYTLAIGKVESLLRNTTRFLGIKDVKDVPLKEWEAAIDAERAKLTSNCKGDSIQKNCLVWNPQDETLSLEFPIQQEAVRRLPCSVQSSLISGQRSEKLTK